MNPSEPNGPAPLGPVTQGSPASTTPSATVQSPQPSPRPATSGNLHYKSYSSMQRKHIKSPIATVVMFIIGLAILAVFLYFAVSYYRDQSDNLKITNTPTY